MKKKIIVSRQDIIPTPIGNIWESLKSVVYGPIVSRRFRYSLGINLFKEKICSLNCSYCDLGKTNPVLVKDTIKKNAFLTLKEISTDIEKAFIYHKLNKTDIDKITICGNGEATLHPNFPEIVEILIKFRDMYFPKIPTAILTAPTEINNKKISQSLEKLDIRIFKLDAGDSATYRRICRPIKSIATLNFNNQLKYLQQISAKSDKSIIISSAIVKSKTGNYTNIESIVNKMPDILEKISPAEYHIHNIDYPIYENDSSILRLEINEMLNIADQISNKTDIPIKVLHSAKSLREDELKNYKPSEYKQVFDFKPKILLLDDDEKFQQSISLTLSKYFEFYFAQSSDEAKDILNNPIDIIIVDINLTNKPKDLSGLKFIQWNKHNKNIPFIVVTGYKEEDILKKIRSTRPQFIFSRTLDVMMLKDEIFLALYKKKMI